MRTFNYSILFLFLATVSLNAQSWTVFPSFTTSNLKAVAVRTNSLVCVAGDGGIFRTTDGTNWGQVLGDSAFHRMQFVDIETRVGPSFLAIGEDSVSQANRLYASYDDGASWSVVLDTLGIKFNKIYYNGGHFIIGCDGGRLLLSNNSGQNWRVLQIGAQRHIRDLADGVGALQLRAVGDGFMARFNYVLDTVHLETVPFNISGADKSFINDGHNIISLAYGQNLLSTSMDSSVIIHAIHSKGSLYRSYIATSVGLFTYSPSGNVGWYHFWPTAGYNLNDMDYGNHLYAVGDNGLVIQKDDFSGAGPFPSFDGSITYCTAEPSYVSALGTPSSANVEWYVNDSLVSTDRNLIYQFPFAGLYELKMRNIWMAYDSLVRNVMVYDAPDSNMIFYPLDSFFCDTGQIEVMIPNSTLGVTYRIRDVENNASLGFAFGTGDTIIVQSSFITDSTSYYLELKNGSGCTTVVKDTQYMYVEKVIADFHHNCINYALGDSLKLYDLSINGGTYGWNFGTGSQWANMDSLYPIVVFDASSLGYRDLKSVVTSPNGCMDSISKQIWIYDPSSITENKCGAFSSYAEDYGGSSTSLYGHFHDLETDENNNLFIVGRASYFEIASRFGLAADTINNFGGFLAKYDDNNILKWLIHTENEVVPHFYYQSSGFYSLVVDKNEGSALVGADINGQSSTGTQNGTVYFNNGTSYHHNGYEISSMFKISKEGNLVWDFNSDYGKLTPFAVDSSGNYFVKVDLIATSASYFVFKDGQGNFDTIVDPFFNSTKTLKQFILKLDTDGQILWNIPVADNSSFPTTGLIGLFSNLKVDANGNLYMIGNSLTSNEIFLQDVSGQLTEIPTAYTVDYFIVKVSSNGIIQWFHTEEEIGKWMDVDAWGNTYYFREDPNQFVSLNHLGDERWVLDANYNSMSPLDIHDLYYDDVLDRVLFCTHLSNQSTIDIGSNIATPFNYTTSNYKEELFLSYSRDGELMEYTSYTDSLHFEEFTIEANTNGRLYHTGQFSHPNNNVSLEMHGDTLFSNYNRGIYLAWMDPYLCSNPTAFNTTLSQYQICAGDSLELYMHLQANDSLQANNVYTVELSDSSGSFTNPIILATDSSSLANNTIRIGIPSNLTAGTYRLRVLASSLSYTSWEMSIIVHDQLTQGTFLLDTLICANDSIQLSARFGLEHLWTPSTNLDDSTKHTPLIYGDTTPIYYQIQTTGYCGQFMDTILVRGEAPIEPSLTINGGSTYVCHDDTLELSYMLVNEGINPTISWNVIGLFSTHTALTITASDSVVFILPNDPYYFEFTDSVYAYLESSEWCITSDRVYSNKIAVSENTSIPSTYVDLPRCTFQPITYNGVTYTANGIYEQILQDEYGCDSILYIDVYNSSAACTNVEELEANSTLFKAYPNPADTELYLEFEQPTIFRYQLVDLLGRILKEGVEESATTHQIDLQNLEAGSYVLMVFLDNGSSDRVLFQKE